MNARIKICTLLLLPTLLINCKNSASENSKTEQKTEVKVNVPAPNFDSKAAYEKIKKQVDFGDRVPNSAAHKACGDWIVASLKGSGLDVIEQKFEAISVNAMKQNARNIIGQYRPEATKRVILAAHWDTRPIADQDDERKKEPIPGANDGGSGVAVLLQMAEAIHQATDKPDLGIDFIFFDVEDGGSPSDYTGKPFDEYGGYLMGSDYWSKNPHKENYSAFYGILLDMVGAKGATFYREPTSMQVAPSVVNNVWSIAAEKGYGGFFKPVNGPAILDDHVPVIKNLKIPMIDIVDMKISNDQTFFDHWHTHDDDMDAIDEATLEAVGETLMQTIYNENGIIKAI